MDYFVVLLLILIIFMFLSDKKFLNLQEVKNKIDDIEVLVEEIYKDTLIINIEEGLKENIDELINQINIKVSKDKSKKYIILKDNKIRLTNQNIKNIISNYINKNQKICGFMASYKYNYTNNKLSDIKEEMYVAIINYLNIFSKNNLHKYAVFILKTTEVEQLANYKFSNIVSFSPCEEIMVLSSKENKNNLLRKINKIYDSDIKMLLKSILLIFTGVVATGNLIYAIYMFDITEIIISVIVYWCYNYILKHMYKPIGGYKILAKYLFPIFLICYMTFLLFSNIIKLKKSNKKVQAS